MPSQIQRELRGGTIENLVPENLTFSEVGHLPIIKDFAKKINLVETLDAMVDSEMELSPGIAILAMVLDTLSGRTPLYRMEEFFQEKDTELMLGYLERTKSEISGWKNRPTKRPTSFMMTTKFLSILVARSGTQRQLVRPLKPVQPEFLQAMGVNPEVFVKP